MKRTMTVMAAILFAGMALPAAPRAQVFYAMPGARPVSDASPVLGLALGIGDNLFRLVGLGRFNAAASSDLGLEVAYEDLDTGPGSDGQHRFGAGIDFKHVVVWQQEETPVDVAVQVGAGILAQSHYTLIKIPVGAIASRSFTVEGGREIVPYGGAYLIMDFFDVDAPGNPGWRSDLDVEFRVGGSAEIVDGVAAFAALHAGNGTMFFLGFRASL